MAQLTLYGGVGQIGGNKMLLEDGDVRLFFDFGIPFGVRYAFFEEYLKPRASAGLLDLLEMGLLPPLRGIYRPDLEGAEDVWERFAATPLYRELEGVGAVFLSHAHVDHSGYISFLRGDIPVLCTPMTAFIAKAMQSSAPADFEKEVCYFSPRVVEDRCLVIPRGASYQQRPFTFLGDDHLSEEADRFWVESPAARKRLDEARPRAGSAGEVLGGLRFRHFPVDHSVFGASAYAVETSAGWVGYTGDLRLHGGGRAQTERFMEEMAALRPLALMCEGTQVGGGRPTTEAEVYDNVLRTVSQSRGLVVADFGPRNVERLITFHRVARREERQLVILAKDAYLLDAMRLVSDEVPDVGAAGDILLYKDLKSSPMPWEQRLREKYKEKLIAADQVHRSQDDYILCFSFWDVKNLIDIAPSGGTYIYSSSEAYDEEQQIDMKRLRAWLDHFQMKGVGLPQKELNWRIPEEEQGLHASGHATQEELLELVRRIAPKVLIPIHTEHPELFQQAFKGSAIEVRVPMLGETIIL